MYTPERRQTLRAQLLQRASEDQTISAAAITGSAAARSEDEWSDIDLAFGVRAGAALSAVLEDWTRHMYAMHGAVAHTDVRAGQWIYRVFFLADTLQVDLAFVPQSEFRPLAPTFELVFGEAGESLRFPLPDAVNLIGMTWLHALHVRSALARGRVWQAEYMINGARQQVLTLACLRHGVSPHHGRGYDQLPREVLAPLEASFPCGLDHAGLQRAFAAVIEGFLVECRCADPELAGRLETPLRSLA